MQEFFHPYGTKRAVSTYFHVILKSHGYCQKIFAANKLVLTLDTTNIMKFTQIIHHILHYILVTRKVYRRDGKYRISWYTNW